MYILGGIIDFFTSLNGIFYTLAYLVGGIPFGLLYGKLLGGVDIREVGSGSIGATNVLRALKQSNPKLAKKVAILTMLSDALKGMVVIAIAKLAGLDYEAQWMLAFLAVLGHCFSPFLKFEGGKGVATTVGVIAVFLPIEAILGLIVWFLVGKFLKISSLASLLGLLIGISSSFIIHPEVPYISTHTPLILISIIVIYKHIPNIVRLIQNKEQKII
ncbi:glycerol-3-phosphate 1-O-acyltransferase PlsY [Helicobacter winghamensis]|uniref:Glycerol-3-phosphate acyltransferase n=1 Tax=Helicobacter winghamensis TaxID=157268 RepID=A0A2N3PKT3_9HELI|nr:glycerol-3-phosphate 1-O-acyltransferase PlsY [Helicobacter winghamensis]EEO25829.1 acyl-phosphate glycerol 3-phosphate acyltransferase [Helicobacter winghamensis ATCC BAA-430]PKT78886.1 glycerol-3-phosphate acyltransferase [Helicobacter winghamensis]PKT78924.1 glycerol-3-phosphate acyltransferase [Helicobacter winghamensis]PKT79050.1 glycerol-3-phosphate acyltransferase [Helicobacter winghamensis]PKT82235.1 glycerol-3-phosphate acyltransferase [Helicobacter winghamensis]